MPAPRVVEPEWLDELPAADPRAARSRRDLVRINALMGNARMVARALERSGEVESIAEIGAGDGAFMHALLTRVGSRPREIHLVDKQAGAGIVAMDVFDWLSTGPQVDAIVANLFLHHFEPPAIARMLSLIAQRARVFVACEPRRSSVALTGARLLGLIGCNDVSRHDAVVSVRAGFAGEEITAAWPKGAGWSCEERAGGLFSHLFVARAK
jgi:hypothetical protein